MRLAKLGMQPTVSGSAGKREASTVAAVVAGAQPKRQSHPPIFAHPDTVEVAQRRRQDEPQALHVGCQLDGRPERGA